MKAIVLSCDRYSVFRNHMILKYSTVWPDHPFTFRIPYQDTMDEGPITGISCEFVKTPVHIKHCVLSLLEDLDENEWIYWCIDDKYPIQIDVEAFSRAHDYVCSLFEPTVSGILLCRPDTLLKRRPLDYEDLIRAPWGETLIARRSYNRIWLHQFTRVKVIRYLFESFPDTPFSAKKMDYFKKQISRPERHRLFVTRGNHAVFGESTTRGQITRNCARSLAQEGLSPRERFDVTAREKLIGLSKKTPNNLALKFSESLAFARLGYS